MLIIIEGPNCAGKSTLAAQLQIEAEDAGQEVELRHAVAPTRPPWIEYTDIDYEPGRGKTLILDRWHLGEEVYGPLLRGESGFTPMKFELTERFLRDKGALLVLLAPALAVLEGRAQARGEHGVDDLAAERLGFLRAYKRSRLVKTRFMTPQVIIAAAQTLEVVHAWK